MQEFYTSIEMWGINFSVWITYGYKDGYQYYDYELTGPEAVSMNGNHEFDTKLQEAIAKYKQGEL